MLRRASSVLGARVSSAIDVSCASTTKVSCTNKLASSRSTSRVFEKVKCFSSRLPKPTSSNDGFAGACEVYDESQRRLATGIAIPLGFGAGVFGSLVGVGGGVLIVPAMTATVPIPQRVIVGTSLIAVLATASFASLNFYTAGAVDFVCAAVVGSAAFVFAPLGAMSTAKLNAQSLKRVLAYFLLLAAPLVPLKAYAFDAKSEKKQLAKKKKLTFESITEDPASAVSLSLIGACAGFASGLLGIGGGTIVTPLLAITTDLPQATVLGTSLLAMLLPSAAALNQHQKMKNVDWRIGTALALGCAVGGFVGSGFAVDASKGALELAFFTGMLFLSYKTFKGLRKGVGGLKMKG